MRQRIGVCLKTVPGMVQKQRYKHHLYLGWTSYTEQRHRTLQRKLQKSGLDVYIFRTLLMWKNRQSYGWLITMNAVHTSLWTTWLRWNIERESRLKRYLQHRNYWQESLIEDCSKKGKSLKGHLSCISPYPKSTSFFRWCETYSISDWVVCKLCINKKPRDYKMCCNLLIFRLLNQDLNLGPSD